MPRNPGGNMAGKDKYGKFVKGNAAAQEATKYKPEYCDMILRYFKDDEVAFPTFELFAVSIGVTNTTLKNWRDNIPDFNTAYTMCREMQKGRMVEGAMTGTYNPMFAKFLASAVYGMTEKTAVENEVTVKGIDKKTIDMIERVAARQK